MPVAEEEPRADPTALDVAVRKTLARRKLKYFFRESWKVLEKNDELVWNWHLEAICDHVQALIEGRISNNNLLINVPPGSSKSRIVSVCAIAWWWIDHPWFRAIYASANPRVATRDSLYCRQLITSPWYQQWFKPAWKLTGDQNAKMLYQNTEGGYRQAIGGGAGVTGDRANGLFMDDMLDAVDAESRAAHEAFATWYDQAFANRVSNIKGVRCNIGQRLHESDPAGHLLASNEWDALVIPQEFALVREKKDDPNSKLVRRKPTSIGWTDPRTTVGEAMDPVRFPESYRVSERGRLGSRGYSAQHQQDPNPAEGTIVKKAWFKWFRLPTDAQGNILPPDQVKKILGINRLVQSWDTALGEKQENDFTASFTFGETETRYMVLDLTKDRLSAPRGKAAINAQHAKWNAHAVVVEGGSSASGKAAVQTIQSESRMPIIELPVLTDKVVGLNQVAPTVEAGVVWLPENHPMIADFVESITKFPAATHDDDVDAFRIGLRYLLFGGAATGMLDYMRQQMAKKAAVET